MWLVFNINKRNSLLLPIIAYNPALAATLAEVAYFHVGRVHLICSKVFLTAEFAYEYGVVAHIGMFEVNSHLGRYKLWYYPHKPFKALFHLFEILFFGGAACKILKAPHYYMYKHNLCIVK